MALGVGLSVAVGLAVAVQVGAWVVSVGEAVLVAVGRNLSIVVGVCVSSGSGSVACPWDENKRAAARTKTNPTLVMLRSLFDMSFPCTARP